ncbi:hypothetical protein WDU94_000017 [Cyamophila willieti]
MYADDIKLYKVIRSENDCKLLQEDIDNIQNFLVSELGLHFHPDKCFKMSFSNKNNKLKKIECQYKINNQITKEVNCINDLGITITNNLEWGPHMKNVVNKAYRKFGLIIRYCQPITDIDTLTTLYKTLMRSTIEYGSVIWTPRTKEGIKTIEKIQAKFIRYLFKKANGFYPKYPQNISYKVLIENLPIDSIEERFKKNQMTFLQNTLTNRINSPYILSQINLKIPTRNLRPNPTQLFYIKSNSKNELKSPITACMLKYNSLPQNEQPNIFV